MPQKKVISQIRTVIVSHMDVCKNTFTYLSDKTHGFIWRFIHSGGASSVILQYAPGNVLLTWLSAVNKMNFIYKFILIIVSNVFKKILV